MCVCTSQSSQVRPEGPFVGPVRPPWQLRGHPKAGPLACAGFRVAFMLVYIKDRVFVLSQNSQDYRIMSE